MTIISAEMLGSAEFKREYGLRYAYLAGAMYKAIASKELVAAMGRAGFMGYFGSGGVALSDVEAAILHIKKELGEGRPYGVNLLCNFERPDFEDATVELFLKHGVRNIEAAAFVRITPALVRYRLKGLTRGMNGEVQCRHRVLAKVSRPEVAGAFMQPAPEDIVKGLLAAGKISQEQAELSARVPMSNDICVESDSAGHTDQGVAYAVMPAMIALRDAMQIRHQYARPLRIGAAGGIGTPHAAAAAFIMGADFVLTGSINQCTVEAGTSEAVKDLLQDLNVQDMAYAPAGDLFEVGAKVQVAKRGLFFPARGNKLYELYMRHNSLDEIDLKTRQQIEEKYFRRSFAEVWEETKSHYSKEHPSKIADIERNPKRKMALVFKWYFINSTRLALRGVVEQKVDFQIHCGPALGAFNQWVKGSELEHWRNRHVAQIGTHLMQRTAELLSQRFAGLTTHAVSQRLETDPEAQVAIT